jgi:hypothetical protein
MSEKGYFAIDAVNLDNDLDIKRDHNFQYYQKFNIARNENLDKQHKFRINI